MRQALLAAALAAAPAAAGAQSAADSGSFALTVPSIMRGPELYGREPERVRWSPDSRWIYFRWLPPGSEWRRELAPYRVRAVAGAAPEAVSEAHMDSVAPLLAEGVRSADGRRRVVESGGDLWLVEGARARRLTETLAAERSPSLDRTGGRVFYLRDDDAFALDLATGLVRQLTDVRRGTPPRDERDGPAQREALEREQRALLGVVRDEAARDSLRRAERMRRDSARVRPLWLGQGERVAQLEVSPAGDALLLVATTPAEGAKATIVPNYVTASGYTEDLTVRTKVGDAQGASRVAHVRLPSGDATWLDATPGDSAAAVYSARLNGWSADGESALLVVNTADFKTRHLLAVDADGTVRPLDTLVDSAWVAGPCAGCAGWTPDGRRAWFVSEADGFAHLYTVSREGGERRQLTSGRWEVLDVRLTDDGRDFLLHTSEVSPFERHAYRLPVGGGAMTRLTTRRGGHEVVVSPDGRLLADVHSVANRPPELFVLPNRAGGEMAQLTTSPTAEWLAFDWKAPAIVRIPASDGAQVPARIYRPEDVGARPNGAGVIFVHGAGYLHNVHDWWSSYAREYMFNHLLASKGYVVLDIDYRASAGYGRDWRTAIYRHMGGRDLQDQVDGSRYLQQQFGIEPERVGIYGGSYGGFITLMALFTEPQHFGAGAALRSVTDWAHYNHPYTGRILNLPQDDTLAYRRSSPIYFAEGLEDPLLIAHGMVDVNVHFQDVVRLSQRLIELGKTDWEMAVYPVEDHGFERPSSWTDEYRRILELFDRHLPIGAPAEAAKRRAAAAAMPGDTPR